jgi:hypothetical protein
MKIRQMFEALARVLAHGKGMESSKVSDSGILVHDYEIFLFMHVAAKSNSKPWNSVLSGRDQCAEESGWPVTVFPFSS